MLKENCGGNLLKNKLPEHVQKIIQRYSQTIVHMLEEKKQLEEEIKSRNNRDVELVKSIPGMGEISAKTILAAIGEINGLRRRSN